MKLKRFILLIWMILLLSEEMAPAAPIGGSSDGAPNGADERVRVDRKRKRKTERTVRRRRARSPRVK